VVGDPAKDWRAVVFSRAENASLSDAADRLSKKICTRSEVDNYIQREEPSTPPSRIRSKKSSETHLHRPNFFRGSYG
jgi:hypothetical protein